MGKGKWLPKLLTLPRILSRQSVHVNDSYRAMLDVTVGDGVAPFKR